MEKTTMMGIAYFFTCIFSTLILLSIAILIVDKKYFKEVCLVLLFLIWLKL